MHIKNTIQNFIYDKNYYIGLFQDSCYLFQCQKIISINDNMAYFRFPEFNLKIKGQKLIIEKMTEKELLIHGVIEELKIEYDK